MIKTKLLVTIIMLMFLTGCLGIDDCPMIEGEELGKATFDKQTKTDATDDHFFELHTNLAADHKYAVNFTNGEGVEVQGYELTEMSIRIKTGRDVRYSCNIDTSNSCLVVEEIGDGYWEIGEVLTIRENNENIWHDGIEDELWIAVEFPGGYDSRREGSFSCSKDFDECSFLYSFEETCG